jgi:hypothetical protein
VVVESSGSAESVVVEAGLVVVEFSGSDGSVEVAVEVGLLVDGEVVESGSDESIELVVEIGLPVDGVGLIAGEVG